VAGCPSLKGEDGSEAAGWGSAANTPPDGLRPPPSPFGEGIREAPTLSHVVTTLAALGKTELPRQLSTWLDALDETGRWALLKLVTGALRIGVSARLAKTAVAALGDKQPDEVELVWHGLAPPYGALFAWIEGRAEKPISIDPAPFRPVMLSHAIEETDFPALDPRSSPPNGSGTASVCKRSRARRMASASRALFAHRRGRVRRLS